MKSFKEFRRLFEIQSNRNNKNNHILTKRRNSISKKDIIKFHVSNTYNSTRHYNFRKNQSSTDNYKTINFLLSSQAKLDDIEKQFSENKKKIKKPNQILNNIKKDKFSFNITTDSTVNLTDNYNSCKSLYNIQINKKLDYLKERCFNLLTKYNKILDNIENKNND
jgi:hypothetical protein